MSGVHEKICSLKLKDSLGPEALCNLFPFLFISERHFKRFKGALTQLATK